MEVDFNKMLKKSSFIITRFNLKLFSKDKNNKTTLTDQWLKERFELFETYCFPSVEGQVLQNFYWLCLFADDTQEQFKQRAIALHRAYPAFLPLFLNDSESEIYLDYINQVISELKDSSDKLITIRLDNDDSININYTKEVDKLYGEQLDNEVCYSFKYGIPCRISPISLHISHNVFPSNVNSGHIILFALIYVLSLNLYLCSVEVYSVILNDTGLILDELAVNDILVVPEGIEAT